MKTQGYRKESYYNVHVLCKTLKLQFLRSVFYKRRHAGRRPAGCISRWSYCNQVYCFEHPRWRKLASVWWVNAPVRMCKINSNPSLFTRHFSKLTYRVQPTSEGGLNLILCSPGGVGRGEVGGKRLSEIKNADQWQFGTSELRHRPLSFWSCVSERDNVKSNINSSEALFPRKVRF